MAGTGEKRAGRAPAKKKSRKKQGEVTYHTLPGWLAPKSDRLFYAFLVFILLLVVYQILHVVGVLHRRPWHAPTPPAAGER